MQRMTGRRVLIVSILIGLMALSSTVFSQETEGTLRWVPGFPMLLDKQVGLMWTEVTGAASYNIYKSEKEAELGALMTSTTGTAVKPPDVKHLYYSDTDIKSDRSYFYTIKAVINGFEGETSQVGAIFQNRPILAPTLYSINSVGKVHIRSEQPKGSGKPVYYKIYKANSINGEFNLVATVKCEGMSGEIFIDNFDEKAIVYYKVTAVDANNIESPMSESLQVKYNRPIIDVPLH